MTPRTIDWRSVQAKLRRIRKLRPSVGMRNVLVHNYLDTDRAVVAGAVPLAVEQYGEYVRQVAAFVAGRT